MNLNEQHANFSLALEMLSLLPCEPHRALVADLVADLGLNEADDLKPLVMQLRTDGYQVGLENEYVWIPKAEWTPCQEASANYLQMVYSGDEQEAM